MILIGSRALKLRAGSLLNREPKDFDFVATEDRALEWLSKHDREYSTDAGKLISPGKPPVEFDLITDGSSNALLIDLVKTDGSFETPFGMVPSLDLLFTIKSSHKYKKNSPHFWKNLKDYHRMKGAGAKVRPEFELFFRLREKESYASQTHPKLNVMKKDFFTGDGVQYVYDHDDIHRAVAHLERPAYTYYMKDGSQVFSSKSKFLAQPREVQLYGVIEECATLAIERSLVPFSGKLTPKEAILFAYSKVCTSITSGWFREFAYDNAPTILPMMNDSYWHKFQIALQSGQVNESSS